MISFAATQASGALIQGAAACWDEFAKQVTATLGSTKQRQDWGWWCRRPAPTM